MGSSLSAHGWDAVPMAKSARKRAAKTTLKLPDLEQSKHAVSNSLSSPSSRRSYDHVIRDFIDWYCSEPRLAFYSPPPGRRHKIPPRSSPAH